MKSVFVVDSHQEVLKWWEKSFGSNLFSLDYHTDTKPAFGSFSAQQCSSGWRVPDSKREMCQRMPDELVARYLNGGLTLSDCIDRLRNDEHIDFAIRTGIVDNAFVVPRGKGGSNGYVNKAIFDNMHQEFFEAHRIVEYDFVCLDDCKRAPHDDICIERLACYAIDDLFLSPAVHYIAQYYPLFFDNYILDIDLDYFGTMRAFNSKNISVFIQLIRGANIITIARESACVDMCKLEGARITADSALCELQAIIREAQV